MRGSARDAALVLCSIECCAGFIGQLRQLTAVNTLSTRNTTLTATSSSHVVPQKIQRRSLLERHVGGVSSLAAGWALLRRSSRAANEETLVRNTMGGLLEPYTDTAKGVKLFSPAGWNQFDGSPETYVVKWADIINRDEQVVLNATPVKSTTTSVSALGEVGQVGEKLAKARGAQLVEARERSTEGITFYQFEFKGDKISEVFELCVNKGRLWSLSATSATSRWNKRADLLRNVLGSFLPKL